MENFKVISKKNIKNLPETTGIYLFLKGKQKLYIGKAINIKNRVKNHFNQPSYRDNLFIDKINKIGFLKTQSEIEALILEANLIKKYQPKYNVMWRDDKNFFHVAITKNKNKIPYIYITHQKDKKNTQYVGPFVEGTALKKTLRFLRRAFPYYTKDNHSKNKCTWCHLDLCPGPNPNLTEYKKNIKKLILILKGERSAVVSSLKKEMKHLAKEKKFEEAGKIRDKIYSLKQIMAHAHVIGNVTGYVTSYVTPNEMALQKIIGLNKKINRIECYDVSNIQGKQATGSMVVFSAQGGPASGWIPDKSQYKKFKIKTLETPNDIAMLKQVLQRRFNHPEWKFPEVILIDGGKAQLNTAIKSKNLKTKNIKVLSLAKRNKELFIEGENKPILLKSLPQEIYNLIISLDQEAHRFAINYHKKLRKKGLIG